MIILMLCLAFVSWVFYESYNENNPHREETLSSLLYTRMKEILSGGF